MYVRGKARRVVRKRPVRTRQVKSKRMAKPKVSLGLKKYINTVVHRNIENKTIGDKNDIDFASYLSNIDLAVTAIHPNPSSMAIASGTGQSQRVGNTITTRKLLLKYIIHPNPEDANLQPQPQPQEVIVWIGYLKGNRMKQPDLNDYNQFYQDGSTTQAPHGNLWDCLLPVNLDRFHICRTFRHKLGNAVYTDFQGIKSYNYYTNNDFAYNVTRTVDCTKYINKVLKFDDGSLTPDTGLYMWMTAVPADGTQGFQSKVCRMSYTVRYDYEDA